MRSRVTIMSKLTPLNVFKCVLLLLLFDTVAPSCSDFKWAETDHNNYIWSIVGEWRIIDCSVENNEHVQTTLWFKDFTEGNNNMTERKISGRIKLTAKNVFNITNLQLNDMGNYYCQACKNTKKPLRITVYEGTPFGIPEITKQPNTPVKYESTVTLECSLKGSYADYEMIWFKESQTGETTELTSRSRSTWSPDYNKQVQRKVLTINNFKQKNEGKYFCRVKRYAVNHVGIAAVHLRLETLHKPTINIIGEQGDRKVNGMESEDIIVRYTVSGVPPPDVEWYKSVNGKQELYPIAKCSGKTKSCSYISKNDLDVTMESFIIRNASYLEHHNVTYSCLANNVQGKNKSNFTVFVNTKLRLTAPKSEIQLYKKNLRLECKLSVDVNPINISYSWEFCDENEDTPKSVCHKAKKWTKHEGNNSIIPILPDQTIGIRYYRCTVKNTMKSSAQVIWMIVSPRDNKIPVGSICESKLARLAASPSEKEDHGTSIEPIVVWQCIVAFLVVVLLLTLFLTYRRRNLQKCKDYNTCIVPALEKKIGERV